MKTSRICAAVVATLALCAAGSAQADGVSAGSVAVLNPYLKVLVDGNTRGPDRLGQKTGAGTMDAAFTWDQNSYATDPSVVNLATLYTRSNDKPNNNNSYMQGGVALAKLTATGVVPGPMVDLPNLNGDRPFMRPQIAFVKNAKGTRMLAIAASEDNNSNNGNPKPVAFLLDGTSGQVIGITNNTRGNGASNLKKPTDLIRQAQNDGINVNNANNQRGPHSIAPVPGTTNSFIVGMQYNNQAAEAFRVTVRDDDSVHVDWLVRYSNTAQHCRPQVAINATTKEGFITEVEANNQPAEIGFRITKFNIDTGKATASKIAVRSQPTKRLYVAEPSIAVVGDKLAIEYSMTNARGNKTNGHANRGAQLSTVALFNQSDLTMSGNALPNAGQFSRHAHLFGTTYGPNGEPAIAVISASSDGQGGGFQQILPINADGTLGLKDPLKSYKVAQYADVANVQARGKRNPNDQAKGFINGLGDIPNPGFTTDPVKAQTNFMPEVKTLQFSAITGYSDPAAALKGIKNSIWLSLVPGSWQEGLQTVPGTPTDKPGTNVDGTGPAPRSDTTPVDPSGNASSDPGSVIPGGDGPSAPSSATGERAALGADNGGCSESHGFGSSSSSGGGLIALAIAGAIVAFRRKREEA
jgi:hypothetical protein